ncbi:MAG: glucosaminidase domain-containing protein [Anaerorhabdus sp.]
MIKKWILSLVTILILVANTSVVQAVEIADLPQNDNYTVVAIQDGEIITLKTFKVFSSAKSNYEATLGDYDNLLIVQSGKVVQAQYAIVKIQSTTGCDYNVEFVNDEDGNANYTNGCYGADAAYLDTNSSATKVKFKISGTIGWASIDDMTIIPVEFLSARLSTYVVKEGNLYHQIKQSFESDLYAAMINLGPSPAYLESDLEYYSYDGHYFYNSTQLNEMLDDYKEDNYTQSVNNGNPYYNYYQYVSHRTITNVTVEDVEKYFENTLGIIEAIDTYSDLDKDSANDTLTQSQYYNQESAFYQYQYQYGANALMMLALSMNETSFGRSSLSFTRNNLFGHAAYDSDVEKNASRYFSVHSSIYSHAKYYISGSYSSPLRFQFHGGFFGNKGSGMNVSYASDPYWGEKAAQYYLTIDEIFGFKDYNSETLGIKTSTDNVIVYLNPSEESSVLYQTGVMPDFAFVLLDEVENSDGKWYKIQSEATYTQDGVVDVSYYYDYENYVGYIHQDDVDVILNEEAMSTPEWIEVTFDANGGQFQDGTSSITYKINVDATGAIETPNKEDFYFSGWDQNLTKLTDGMVIVAQYDEVESIEWVSLPKQDYEYNDRIDLGDGIIRINFANGKNKLVQLTSSMVSGYDLKEEVTQEVIVSVAGKTLTYEIEVSQVLDEMRQELQDDILKIIEEMGNLEKLTDEQADRVLALKEKMDTYMIPYLTQSQLRVLDKLIYMAIDHRIYYVIYDNELEASVSGLSLAIPLGDSLNRRWFRDTYKMVVKESMVRSHYNVVKDVATGSGYAVYDSFTITIEKNLQQLQLNDPIVISIKKPKNTTANQLFTVLMYDDGNVVKCYTKQTDDYIQFMAPNGGEFVVVSRNTTNEYLIENVIENVRVDNRDIDLPLIGTILLIILLFITALIMLADRQWRWFKRKSVEKKLIKESAEIEAAVEKKKEG